MITSADLTSLEHHLMSRDPAKTLTLKHDLVYALVDAAPPGWLRMDLVCRATVDVQDFTLTVLTADGHAVMDIPDEAVEVVLRLRSEYYEPGEGTWFSLRFIVDPPTRFRIIHNLGWDPEWQSAVDPQAWTRDLEAFPRDAAHIPPWLRDRLGQPVDASPPGPLDEQRLWVEIANRLALSVPTDWAQVTVTYRVIGDHSELPVLIRRFTDGTSRPWEPPPGIVERLARLRAGMYRPGRGTWFQVVAHLLGDVSIEFEYTWDDQPAWDVPPPVSAFVNELATFPRDSRRVPAWWTERLGPVAKAFPY
nr:hypothetical protein [Kibdelosporangium sp. MJ126-NF4]CEL18250.1 hypothetical protein [Kibdelosporangium sp. MJ126-NF4]CTQ90351.1 hypothetical protein [Kibdelosporangium sp. MJ126-NF4]